MSKTKERNQRVRFLALFHRYGIPAAMVASIVLCIKFYIPFVCLVFGIELLLLAAYDTAGYFLRWRHVYCAWQDTKRRPMTPNDIRWGTVDKREYFICVAMDAVMGVALIIVQLVMMK